MRPTHSFDDGLTLERDDLVLDTRSSAVKRFHGVETVEEVIDTDYVCWHDASSLSRGYGPSKERATSVRARLTNRHPDWTGRSARYVTAESFPLPVAAHAEVGSWLLNRVEAEKLATWSHGPYTLTVGKGYATTTRAEYGVALRRPKVSGKGPTSTREECIFRADSFEQALSGAVAFMKTVSIDTHGDDDHAFDFFRLGTVKAPLYPEDISEGDIVEFHQMVKELTLSSDADETFVNGGKPTGQHKSEETYVGEVIRTTDSHVHVAKYNGFSGSTALVAYDQLAGKVV
jgi:hypothetical protein